MFDKNTMNPAELAAIVESAPKKRTKKAGGQSISTDLGKCAAGDSIPDAASHYTQTILTPPHLDTLYANLDRIVPDWSSGRVTEVPYEPTPEITETVGAIVDLHRLRQGIIKAQTKLILQAKASIRFAVQKDGDYDTEDSKADARKRADKLYAEVVMDMSHPLHTNIVPYHIALEPLDEQRKIYEKELVRLAKRLPVYDWVKSVRGFGDMSFASIVGECGDIGTYSSFSALWKRMGVAVVGGKRQGNPGAGAVAEEWINHGYNRKRRSVGYVAREQLIGGMGKWRPMFGEDVSANPDLTYYQRCYAERARLESAKLELPIAESDKGKESYKKHVSMRAHRYVEKQLLKHLFIEWRRA